MKNPLPQVTTDNSLNKPAHPTGYAVYTYDPQRSEIILFAKLTHLRDVREVCKKRGLTPLDVLLFRTFSDSSEHETFMFIEQYAFMSTVWEQYGPISVEREAWSWDEETFQTIVDEFEPVPAWINNTCRWIVNFFSFFRFI